MVYSVVVGNSLMLMYDFFRKTSRYKYGKILEKTQYLSREQINRLQIENLRALMIHAFRTVPYYHRVFKEKNLKPDDVKTVQDLNKLPILNKAEIRKNFKELISRDFPSNQLVLSKTGGTGSPLRFYKTRDSESWEKAAANRALHWAGYSLGDRCCRIWGSPQDLLEYKNIMTKVSTVVERTLILNAFEIWTNEILNSYAYSLRRFNPEIIHGYATATYMLAKYLLEKGVDFIRPRAAITCAESLLDYKRKTIEAAFDCPVFDYYGSREIGSLASECEEHSGYHISAENVVLEFVREGEHVATGEDGVILVTNLRNYGMPFIRYNIADVGKPTDEICNCGRGLPLMASVEGRISEFLTVYDKHTGKKVPLHPFTIGIGIMDFMSVKEFRIIQESDERVIIKIIKGTGFTQTHTDLLYKHLQKYWGEGIKVEVDFVDYLPPLPSGKRSVVISKLKAFEP